MVLRIQWQRRDWRRPASVPSTVRLRLRRVFYVPLPRARIALALVPVQRAEGQDAKHNAEDEATDHACARAFAADPPFEKHGGAGSVGQFELNVHAGELVDEPVGRGRGRVADDGSRVASLGLDDGDAEDDWSAVTRVRSVALH